MVDDARVEALEAELERANARITQLEEAMGMGVITPVDWKLSPSEMRIFGALLARTYINADAAMAVLYRDQGKEEAHVKILDVFVCKLRKKIGPFGITIETIWGTGYRMLPEVKALARSLIEASMAEMAA